MEWRGEGVTPQKKYFREKGNKERPWEYGKRETESCHQQFPFL